MRRDAVGAGPLSRLPVTLGQTLSGTTGRRGMVHPVQLAADARHGDAAGPIQSGTCRHKGRRAGANAVQPSTPCHPTGRERDLMFLSVFEMFKVGIGPSSSHTMGPMVAAARFLDKMRAAPFEAHGLRGSLHGSLAFTGVGHATDRATILGLAGFRPETYDHEKAEKVLEEIRESHAVSPEGLGRLRFHPKDDLVFDFGPNLPGHANGMILMATDAQGDVILQETYYSVGGGFVMTEAELAAGRDTDEGDPVPYPFKSAAEMLEMAERSGKSIAAMKRANEIARGGPENLRSGVARIWQVMDDCIERGLASDGVLPGGLGVKRRAKGIRDA